MPPRREIGKATSPKFKGNEGSRADKQWKPYQGPPRAGPSTIFRRREWRPSPPQLFPTPFTHTLRSVPQKAPSPFTQGPAISVASAQRLHSSAAGARH